MLHVRRTLALAFLPVIAALLPAVGQDIASVAGPPTDGRNDHYVANRAPLRPSPLIKLPIGAITPEGWLRIQLAREADGFSGRLTELSEFLKKEDNAWLSPGGEGKRGWEEVPYWLKGFGDLGYVLGDDRIIGEARIWIEGALASQRDSGYFGPVSNLTGIDGKYPDLWPQMIMLNALQSYYEYSGDPRVIDLMTRYFRWQLQVPEDEFLRPFWQQQRAADNLASVYWLYNRTGDGWLLELAEKIRRNTANWTDGVANWHGVNIAQAFRGPGVYFQQAQDPKFLAAVERNFQEVRRLYGQVPGGGFGADENCRPGYDDPRQGTETCTWAELMLSHEMMLAITGEPRWADRCEDVAFNSLPASMTADLKGLRYLTCANMILADSKNKSPGIQNGGEMLSYNPHRYRCCQHDVAHAWPYFAEHLWMATADNGLAAAIYAPSKVTAKVADGTEVTIASRTRYPFEETIRLAVACPEPADFPLYLRVPEWCPRPAVRLNGDELPVPAPASGWLVVRRTWNSGDRLELELPMAITLTRWAGNHDAVSVNRGPLTYSLKIGEKYVRYAGTDEWPAYEVHPTTPWNYALVLDEGDPAESFELVRGDWPADGQPFFVDAAPLALTTRARRVPQWKPDEFGLVGLLQDSPVKTDEPVAPITLIPMGCARLRITCFPVAGRGPDAHEWTEPAEPIPAEASHVQGLLSAISDEIVPQRSSDTTIPRFTWWDHKGTVEWVQYTFDPPRTLEHVDVFWFDDTGAGACRVPASWRVLYRDGDTWRPVEHPGEYGVARDRFNGVSFEPVTTPALRIEVQLQEDYSGGILEWRIR